MDLMEPGEEDQEIDALVQECGDLERLVAALHEENERLRAEIAVRRRQVLALLPDLDPGG